MFACRLQIFYMLPFCGCTSSAEWTEKKVLSLPHRRTCLDACGQHYRCMKNLIATEGCSWVTNTHSSVHTGVYLAQIYAHEAQGTQPISHHWVRTVAAVYAWLLMSHTVQHMRLGPDGSHAEIVCVRSVMNGGVLWSWSMFCWLILWQINHSDYLPLQLRALIDHAHVHAAETLDAKGSNKKTEKTCRFGLFARARLCQFCQWT